MVPFCDVLSGYVSLYFIHITTAYLEVLWKSLCCNGIVNDGAPGDGHGTQDRYNVRTLKATGLALLSHVKPWRYLRSR